MEEKKYYCSYKDYAKHRHPFIFYHIMYWIVSHCIPNFKISYKQELEGPNIYVSNHSKQFGPLFAAAKFDKPARIWCDAQLVFYKQAPKYMMHAFFNDKKRFWPLAILLTPIIVNLFRGQEIIPVYRDARLITTYKKTIETMKEGKNVILFAESPKKANEYLNELNQGFVEVGRMVNRYMKQDVNFVPMYIAWSIKEASVGAPIKFDPTNKYRDEVNRISSQIEKDLYELADALPEHKVIRFN